MLAAACLKAPPPVKMLKGRHVRVGFISDLRRWQVLAAGARPVFLVFLSETALQPKARVKAGCVLWLKKNIR